MRSARTEEKQERGEGHESPSTTSLNLDERTTSHTTERVSCSGMNMKLMESNDPSAGSPTETLLRLLLPLDDKVWGTSQKSRAADRPGTPLRTPHRTVQSVGATGGVYKGQGRNQRTLMTCAY